MNIVHAWDEGSLSQGTEEVKMIETLQRYHKVDNKVRIFSRGDAEIEPVYLLHCQSIPIYIFKERVGFNLHF